MQTVHLVVSCAKRKTHKSHPQLRLGSIRKKLPLEERAKEWVCRLRKHSFGQVLARDLYSGDHWHVIRSILDLPRSIDNPIKVWVCSAGYGLIPIDARISPYSATFAPNDLDSVSRVSVLRESLPKWWSILSQYDRGGKEPRSLLELVHTYPDDFLLVALPHYYLTAVSEDIQATVKSARSSDHLAILSVGGSVSSEAEPYTLPTDSRLQGVLGGSLGSLNARLARYLLTELGQKPISFDWCNNKLVALIKEAPELTSTTRKKMTDVEVKTAIRKYLKSDPSSSATKLLRQLRDSGRACEHSRFRLLYQEITGAKNGNG